MKIFATTTNYTILIAAGSYHKLSNRLDLCYDDDGYPALFQWDFNNDNIFGDLNDQGGSSNNQIWF